MNDDKYLEIAAKMLGCKIEELPTKLVDNPHKIDRLIKICAEPGEEMGLRSRQIIALMLTGWSWSPIG